jgi:hypothetical protein
MVCNFEVISINLAICKSVYRFCTKFALSSSSFFFFHFMVYAFMPVPTSHTSYEVHGYIQKFPDWPPGARTANGTPLCH